MKEKMQYFGYTLAGIVKPWEREPNIFAQGFFGTTYFLHVFVAPEGGYEWNLDTYYTEVYCKYSLIKLKGGSTIKEKKATFTSKEDFESFIMEVRSIKERYIG